MLIQFIGAAETVTGSMHYFEVGDKKFVLDCGMYQGRRKEAYELNRTFDYFKPETLDFMILSHAHIDHSGNIPSLTRQGFDGEIYATFATRDLAAYLLQDSAHIQEKDVEFVNKKRKKQGKNLFEPLYTQEDAVEAISRFAGMNYHRRKQICPEVAVTFYDAGHILGSAIVLLELTENGKTIRVGFSGDLGRKNLPILRDPEQIPDVDYWITESTYGGRKHEEFTMTEEKMRQVLTRGIEQRSKLIVPAFSVGRTQELVYLLNILFEKHPELRIPIYVDSPLSSNTTDVFRLHPECFDAETSRFLIKSKDPFGFAQLTYITDVEESKRLNGVDGPMMIISSSGMAEAGRILHHLANNIQNPNTIILMTGYCAPHTLGKKLIDREPEVNIFGDPYQLKADVVKFNSLSAHADSNDLLEYVKGFDRQQLKKIFLVHGDPEMQAAFAGALEGEGYNNVTIPKKGQKFEL